MGPYPAHPHIPATISHPDQLRGMEMDAYDALPHTIRRAIGAMPVTRADSALAAQYMLLRGTPVGVVADFIHRDGQRAARQP